MLGFGFLPLPLGVSFAWYGLYKNEKQICPYLRLTAETKIAIPVGMSLGFKPPAFNSFLFILIDDIRLQVFELHCAGGFMTFLLSRLTA